MALRQHKAESGLRKFLKRGIESVKVEYNLACIAHNMKVMWARVSRNVVILSKIRSSVGNSAVKLRDFLGSRLLLT